MVSRGHRAKVAAMTMYMCIKVVFLRQAGSEIGTNIRKKLMNEKKNAKHNCGGWLKLDYDAFFSISIFCFQTTPKNK